jgi:sulfide:quinone oxidoreductase
MTAHNGRQTVAILGGGVGGVMAANTLRRELPGRHRVLLVERNEWHAFAPSFLWVMTGERPPHRAQTPLASLLVDGVELVRAEVHEIDEVTRKVATSAGELAADWLVIALGAQLAPDAMPGLEAASHTFYTLEGAARLRDALAGMTGGRVAVVVASLPYKCPGAPHEGAMLIADIFRRRGLAGRAQIDLFTPEAQPMPVAGPQLGEAVKSMLAEKDIGFHPLHKLAAVDAGSRQLRFEGGQTAGYDLLVVIPPHRAPDALRRGGLLNAAGWLPVDPHTMETKSPGVFAIGDVTAVPIPGRWKPEVPLMLPRAGVFAHAQGEIAASRIAAAIRGEAPAASFSGEGYCMLETGADEAGFAFGNFFAEPAPSVEIRRVGRAWHWGKVLFEKWWLAPPGAKRRALGWAMKAGAKVYGFPLEL